MVDLRRFGYTDEADFLGETMVDDRDPRDHPLFLGSARAARIEWQLDGTRGWRRRIDMGRALLNKLEMIAQEATPEGMDHEEHERRKLHYAGQLIREYNRNINAKPGEWRYRK